MSQTTRKKTFLDEDFLLDSDMAIDLYRSFAAPQPIIDYHNHLPPDEIAANRRFETITRVWLNGDHYKWRAMRSDGVPERLITGSASDWEKFEVWARTVPRTLRNPLYHWTHLELAFPFGVKGKLLGPETAREIYDHCNRRLAEDDFTTQGLLKQHRVLVVCSTDDPADDLEAHRRHAADAKAYTKLYPTFRPDKALGLHDLGAWNGWVDRLAAAAALDVRDLASFRDALERRHAFFHERGCRASDHGLERIPAAPYTEKEAEAAFAKARAGKALGADEIEKLRSAFTYDFAVMDHRRGWVQQFHLGAMRNNSSRGMRQLGPDTGYDSIGDFPQAETLVRLLDRLDGEGKLAKTVLYNLNPADNEVFATLIGNFQGGDDRGDAGSAVPGKIQLGSAWWFLDQLDGMRKQIDALSNMGLLSRFVGMLTDSRSFLSYSRHDYFRRLLCNILGGEVERGMLPADRALLGGLVADVCFGNARDFFGFKI